MGVSDLPGCGFSDPIWCTIARSATKLGIYTTWSQGNIVQAQYFRDVDQIESYLESNFFLTRLNAEVDHGRNETRKMKENLSSLKNFIMILFAQDTTVVPKESSWFGSYAIPDQDITFMMGSIRQAMRFPWWPFPRRPGVGDRTIIPMREQPLYKEDTIGIRTLDEAGRIHLESCDAVHMHLKLECWEPIVKKYIGGTTSDDQYAIPLVVQAQGY
jgi:palmitoyl-protein thioesterase